MTQEFKLSRAFQDYLKAIYDLTQEGQLTTTTLISERLSVSPASVTSMLNKLAGHHPPLAEYRKHHGVRLTAAGEQAALRTIRQHRLVELFLMKVLGYTWDEVHEDAERLEHAISPRLEDRLAQALGEPDFDPHGDPIPGRDLRVPVSNTFSLTKAQPGRWVVVRRVPSSDAGILRYLQEMGIRPETRLKLLRRVPFDQTLHIQLAGGDDERVLGAELGALIQVEDFSDYEVDR